MYLKAPKASEDGLRVDLRRGRVRLGEGLGFALSGVDDIGITARKIRAVGNYGRNFFFLSGCDVVARGADGNDRLWVTDKKVARTCGVRLYGQAGNDKMIGTNRNDVLVGGQGRDRADAGGGRKESLHRREEVRVRAVRALVLAILVAGLVAPSAQAANGETYGQAGHHRGHRRRRRDQR